MKIEDFTAVLQEIGDAAKRRTTEQEREELLKLIGKAVEAMEPAELKSILTDIFGATEARLGSCSPVLRVLQDETHKVFSERFGLPNESPLGGDGGKAEKQGQDLAGTKKRTDLI